MIKPYQWPPTTLLFTSTVFFQSIMSLSDDETMPPRPPVLQRQTGEHHANDPDLVRYLQFTCNLYSCKYKEPPITWGELIHKDYPHFLELMKTYVRLDTKTFDILSKCIKPEHLEEAKTHQRFYDTREYLDYRIQKYLDYTCTHKGRFNGKTWRHILARDYKYFKWAVQNTMGRHTKTFQILVECLRPEDIETVKASKRQERKPEKENTPPPTNTQDTM